MKDITSRERVMITLSHQEPDKVPVDIGEGRQTSIYIQPYVKTMLFCMDVCIGLAAEFSGWVGIVAPRNTPESIVGRLREASRKASEEKSFIDIIENSGDEVRLVLGEEMAKYWDAESAMLAKVMGDLVKDNPPK